MEPLTDFQEKLLAIVPIPSALLSIVGSYVIICIARRSYMKRTCTPYTRLLLAMSVTDVVFSINLALAPFLRPNNSSTRAWAFGNDASCSTVGLFNQYSLTTRFYNGMLALYFLLTTKFGFTNARISKRIEPVMHAISISYPLVTALGFILKDEYGEVPSALGCARSLSLGDSKESTMVQDGVYFALPTVLLLIILVVCNVMILMFVRQRTVIGSSGRASETRLANEESFSLNDDSAGGTHRLPIGKSSSFSTLRDSSLRISFRMSRSKQTSGSNSSTSSEQSRAERQYRRLKLISSQALLFVASYAMCNIWNVILFLVLGKATVVDQTMYPLAVIEAITLPLQGLFNVIVFVRPKYLRRRQQHPKLSWLETAKCAILDRDPKKGEGVAAADEVQECAKDQECPRPTPGKHRSKSARNRPNGEPNDNKGKKNNNDITIRIPKGMVSSLTASRGDFDHVLAEDKEDQRWGDNTTISLTPTHRPEKLAIPARLQSAFIMSQALSELDVIAEVQDQESGEGDTGHQRSAAEDSKDRWSSKSNTNSVRADSKDAVEQPEKDTPLVPPSRKPAPCSTVLPSTLDDGGDSNHTRPLG